MLDEEKRRMRKGEIDNTFDCKEAIVRVDR